MMEFWSSLLGTLESGRSAYVFLVAANTQHSPGTTGARMFVPQVGEPVGTVGGGGMELDLVGHARRAMAEDFTPRTRTLVHHKKPGFGEPSGLICAGEQVNVEFVVTPNDAAVISDVVDLLAQDKPGVFKVTAQGFDVELRSPRPHESPIQLHDPNGEFRYEEQLLQWKRVAIVGGGHCGLALSRTMSELGFLTTVFDTRAECTTFRDNLFARHLIQVDDYAEVDAQIQYRDLTHVVVMTTDMPSDVRALLGLSAHDYPYVGVMGSPAKIAKIAKELAALGVSKSWFSTLHAPIGLAMQSDTPAEIAISIAAQILSLRTSIFTHSEWAEPE